MSELVIPLHLEPLEEGGYVATSDAIPGLVAQGRTVAETVEIAQDVARKLLESYQAHGDPLPPSLQPVESRGFDLAVPVGLSR